MKWRWLVVVGLAACGGPTGPKRSSAADSVSASGSDSGAGTPEAWRSALYPEDWEPGFETADGQLRDFSHAGFGGGGGALPEVELSAAVDVATFGADPTGETDSTAAIQAAIDSLAGPGTVHLPAGRYRIDGRLVVQAPGTVVAGDGSDRTELWFTAHEGLDHGAHLEFRGVPVADLSVALSADIAAGDDHVRVPAGSGLTAGDEVWIGVTITDAFVSDHGMDGYWTFSLGAWRPFFRRTVTGVEPGGDGVETIVLDVTLPYALSLRDDARIERVDGYLEGVGLTGIAVANAVDWDAAWAHDQVHAVAFEGVRDAWVHDLRSFEPPGGDGHHLQSSGLLVRNSRRVTVADTHLAHSQNRGEGGNGYLVEVRVSNQVLVRDSSARGGRHNFIQNWDFGTSDLVFLRTHSAGSEAFTSSTDPRGSAACSETHHALAIAVLVDDSTVDDCWKFVNRLGYSTGAGHTATESVMWNLRGTGSLTSHQFGRGYVVGTEGLEVTTAVIDVYESQGTHPEDFVEGVELAATLEPASLYDDQLARRLAR